MRQLQDEMDLPEGKKVELRNMPGETKLQLVQNYCRQQQAQRDEQRTNQNEFIQRLTEVCALCLGIDAFV